MKAHERPIAEADRVAAELQYAECVEIPDQKTARELRGDMFVRSTMIGAEFDAGMKRIGELAARPPRIPPGWPRSE
jgi:hypothetical protein